MSPSPDPGDGDALGPADRAAIDEAAAGAASDAATSEGAKSAAKTKADQKRPFVVQVQGFLRADES